jgi:hypothetical protein
LFLLLSRRVEGGADRSEDRKEAGCPIIPEWIVGKDCCTISWETLYEAANQKEKSGPTFLPKAFCTREPPKRQCARTV